MINGLKQYNSLDVLKFVLSLFIVVIHSSIDKTYISPLLRIAVPTFFIISGYLFFLKLEKINDEKEKVGALIHLVKRNVFLYVIWVIIQLPILIFGRHYHFDFLKTGVWNALRDVLLGNGFTGSWYIIALALGTIIIFLLSRKISAKWIVVITLPIYIICCLASNYRGLFPDDSWPVSFFEVYKQITTSEFNTSLPGGLFWISIGNFLAVNRKNVQVKFLSLAIIVSAVSITAERILILKYDLQYHDDCYFSLVVLCPSIFLLVKETSFTFQSRFRFREISTLIYVIHGSCGRIVGFALKQLPYAIFDFEIIKVLITICVAVLISIVILKLRDISRIKVLKYIC